MNPYIFQLTLVHSKLDEAIRREHKQRLPDSLRLLRLKKLRLAIKDRLQRLSFAGERSLA